MKGVIQDDDGNPVLYWFDETGAPTEIGPLSDVDPDETIATFFRDAGYSAGIPQNDLDGKSLPEGFNYLTHNLVYTVQQRPTAGKVNSIVHNISRQFRGTFFQYGTDSPYQRLQWLFQRLSDVLRSDCYRGR